MYIAVLTGAGASAPLKLPTMLELLPNDQLPGVPGGTPESIYGTAVNWSKAQTQGNKLDFELLLTAIDALATMDRGSLVSLPFTDSFSGMGWLFRRPQGDGLIRFDDARHSATVVRKLLRQRIFDTLGNFSAEDAAKLYAPLLRLLLELGRDAGHAAFFTTNYDTAVESLWREGGISAVGEQIALARGFRPRPDFVEAEWDRTEYEASTSARFTVRLFKLHGSLNWIKRGSRILESPTCEYLPSEPHALVYPVLKQQLEEPFATLYSFFASALDRVEVLLVIGASVRDQLLRDRILGAMQKREQLRIVILDPHAEKIRASFPDEFTGRIDAIAKGFGEPPVVELVRRALVGDIEPVPV